VGFSSRRVPRGISQAIRNARRGHWSRSISASSSLMNRDYPGRLAMVALAGLIAYSSLDPSSLAQRTGGTSNASIGTGNLLLQRAWITRTADGMQSAVSALVIVLIGSVIHLQESAWAITASTYVIAGQPQGLQIAFAGVSWDVDRRSARHRLPANRTARTAAGLDTRCCCHDHYAVALRTATTSLAQPMHSR